MDINGRPDHIEDYLVQLHGGQWFGWSDSKNKVYANLVILNSSKSKPSESDCTTGLAALQTAYDNAQTKQTNDESSAKTKLKNLGLTDDEIKALTGK
jgi:hypothetical protein